MWKCNCGEINPDSSSFCQSCGNNKATSEFDEQRQEQIKRERVQQQNKAKIESLTNVKADGYYEYKVLSLLDESGFFKTKAGRVDIVTMTKTLNELGAEGWHLISVYSNELGKDALAGGVGGVMLGVNSTVEENILIFERFVKFK